MNPSDSQQGDLLSWRPAPPAQHHSPTSEAAAESLPPSWLSAARLTVLRHLSQCDGATDEALQDACGLNPSSQRPRRIECVERGLVEDSGRTAPTRSGRQAVVWICTAKGRAALSSLTPSDTP